MHFTLINIIGIYIYALYIVYITTLSAAHSAPLIFSHKTFKQLIILLFCFQKNAYHFLYVPLCSYYSKGSSLAAAAAAARGIIFYCVLLSESSLKRISKTYYTRARV